MAPVWRTLGKPRRYEASYLITQPTVELDTSKQHGESFIIWTNLVGVGSYRNFGIYQIPRRHVHEHHTIHLSLQESMLFYKHL